MFEKVLEHGSPKQLFVTRCKVRHQISEHVDRLRNLKIWDVVDDYNQLDTNFINQVCKDEKFEDVILLESPSTTIEAMKRFPTSLLSNKILQRRAIMAEKEWMKINLEKVSEYKLSTYVYFGLFVDDTKILLSVENPPALQVFDVTNSTARCVYTYLCPSAPYGLCYSEDSMNKVYVSFKSCVEHFQIEITEKVALRKIENIKLEIEMIAISKSSSFIFSRSYSKRMICNSNFSIKHTRACEICGDMPFLSSSSNCNEHAFTLDGTHLVIVDENNKEVLNRSLYTFYARGLAFDLQDNVLVCLQTNKLRQIKHGGRESRDIYLPGIENANNVVLHPTGEKVMVLDINKKFCVYNIE